MPHSFYLRLCMLKDIIATSATMTATFLLEPELGHDSAEAAGFGILLQAAERNDLGGDLGQGEEGRTSILQLGRRVMRTEGQESCEFFLSSQSAPRTSIWTRLRLVLGEITARAPRHYGSSLVRLRLVPQVMPHKA